MEIMGIYRISSLGIKLYRHSKIEIAMLSLTVTLQVDSENGSFVVCLLSRNNVSDHSQGNNHIDGFA